MTMEESKRRAPLKRRERQEFSLVPVLAVLLLLIVVVVLVSFKPSDVADHKKRLKTWAMGKLFTSVQVLVLWRGVVGALVALVLVHFLTRRPNKQSQIKGEEVIPSPKGAIPLLGHALLYKKDPPAFLMSGGDIFRINMAGKEMIVIGRNCPALKQIATSKESTCSARDAIAAVGFEQTLGFLNVHSGTDIHKQILKGALFAPEKYQAEIPKLFQAVERSLEIEYCSMAMSEEGVQSNVSNDNKDVRVRDFFALIRRVILRVTIERLLGSAFLEHGGPDVVKKFMKFQDDLEDATAKAVVLPRWIALISCLWPVQRQRIRLQQHIVTLLKTVLKNTAGVGDQDGIGLWLKEVQDRPIDEIAELIVGLLFAAHKNPAIGTAQAYLFLFERASQEDQNKCREEAEQLSKSQTAATLKSCNRLYAVCMETLRLTAHSIGAIRTARHDFELDETNFTIRKGETIALSHISANLDERVWGKNASDFDTSRFQKDNNKDLYQDEYAFTTFSHGIHKCPGQSLALALMQCTLSVLLAKYNVKLETTDPQQVSFERATLAQREGPCAVLLTPK
jgi:cytochrome P450